MTVSVRSGSTRTVGVASACAVCGDQLRQVSLGDLSAVVGVDQVRDAAQQALLAVWVQGAVSRVGQQQVDVFLGAVGLFPLVATELDGTKAVRLIDLGGIGGHSISCWQAQAWWCVGVEALVTALDFGEECLGATGDVVGRDQCQGAVRVEGVGGLVHPDVGVDPVEGRRREHDVELRSGQRPLLESRHHHLCCGKSGEMPPCDVSHVSAEFDRDNRASKPGQRKRCLAGAAANFQRARSRVNGGEAYEIVEQLGRIARPATIVSVGVFAEGRSQQFPVQLRHDPRLLPGAGEPSGVPVSYTHL